jgi:ABC-type nitrate/sulfonate/bicarbonate transport system substrate-binding protein
MKPRKIKFFAIFFFSVMILAGIIFIYIQNQNQTNHGPLEKLNVGVGKTAVLVYVAQEQGFFAENGLDVTIDLFNAGKLAMDAMINGEVDIATASSSVLVSHSFDRNDIKTFGAIATHQIEEFIARKDHGITQINDIKGKKIGVTKSSAGEAALGRFLVFNGLSFQEVEIVDLTPVEIEEKIINGEIDAALVWEPHPYNIKQALGDKVDSWPGDSDQDSTFLLITKSEWITAYPSKAERFLTSLLQAEQYVKSNDKDTQLFVIELFNYDPDYLEAVWEKYTYSVSLSQELILAMKDEARWRIENHLTDKTVIPNYLGFIFTDPLAAIKPEAITVIY